MAWPRDFAFEIAGNGSGWGVTCLSRLIGERARVPGLAGGGYEPRLSAGLFWQTVPMCRSIKTLRRREGKPTDQEIHDAALQFVRKISGYRVPSRANAPVFEAAVKDVSASSRRLLNGLAS